MSEHQTPPRTGEGDHPKDGGGVLSASSNAYAVAKRERRSGNLPEVLIWRELRKRPGGYKFRRQHPLSDVVIDFVCLECRLAIEIDGEAHGAGDRPERDAQRDIYLRSRGFISYACLRFMFCKALKMPLRLLLPLAPNTNPSTTSRWLAVPLPGPGRCLKVRVYDPIPPHCQSGRDCLPDYPHCAGHGHSHRRGLFGC